MTRGLSVRRVRTMKIERVTAPFGGRPDLWLERTLWASVRRGSVSLVTRLPYRVSAESIRTETCGNLNEIGFSAVDGPDSATTDRDPQAKLCDPEAKDRDSEASDCDPEVWDGSPKARDHDSEPMESRC